MSVDLREEEDGKIPAMDANEPVVIYTTKNLAEAEILRTVLEGEGIPCDLEGENQASFAGVFDIRLLVRAWDEERARRFLASHVHHSGHPKMPRAD
jgi:hypothetical protein